MGGDADGDKPGLQDKLAVVEMVEGEGEAPTIAVSDPAPHASPPQAPPPQAPPPQAPPPRAEASPDAAAMRAEVGELRRMAGELLAALERLDARLRG